MWEWRQNCMVKQLIHQHRVTVTIVFRHGSSGNAKHKIPIVKKVEVGGGGLLPPFIHCIEVTLFLQGLCNVLWIHFTSLSHYSVCDHFEPRTAVYWRASTWQRKRASTWILVFFGGWGGDLVTGVSKSLANPWLLFQLWAVLFSQLCFHIAC